MKNLYLSNDKRTALVDDEDYNRCLLHTWFVCTSNTSELVTAWINGKNINLGRFILEITNSSLEVDHKNLDPFNNCKINLREATRSQNTANHSIRSDNTSGYKGVYFHKQNKKWIAEITVQQSKKCLGSFTDIKNAAKAYNRAAIKYFGEFARLNIIGE